MSDLVVRRLPGLVPYADGWQLQRDEHARVVDGAPGRLLLLQHEAVYTAGKRTHRDDRPTDGTPVVDVDRGGRITWHGPGQLVGYPVVRLPEPVDVVAHVRRLEQALIEVCAGLGVATERVEGRSGVWVRGDGSPGRAGQDRKVAAIGIRVARGVDHARLRPQLRLRPVVGRPDRPVRHRRRRRDLADRRAGPPGHRRGRRGRRRAVGARGPRLRPSRTSPVPRGGRARAWRGVRQTETVSRAGALTARGRESGPVRPVMSAASQTAPPPMTRPATTSSR